MSMPPHTNLGFNGTSANDFMVGGGHYHQGDKTFQHWDLVALNQLGYYEGQITRYVSRAKQKNGMQDYQKALHYGMKMKEIYQTKVPYLFGLFSIRMYKPQHSEGLQAYNNCMLFCKQQKLDAVETNAMILACSWGTEGDLAILVTQLEMLTKRISITETPEEQIARMLSRRAYTPTPAPADGGEHPWVGRVCQDPCEPDAGYVCQDPDLQNKEHPTPMPNAKWPFES